VIVTLGQQVLQDRIVVRVEAPKVNLRGLASPTSPSFLLHYSLVEYPTTFPPFSLPLPLPFATNDSLTSHLDWVRVKSFLKKEKKKKKKLNKRKKNRRHMLYMCQIKFYISFFGQKSILIKISHVTSMWLPLKRSSNWWWYFEKFWDKFAIVS